MRWLVLMSTGVTRCSSTGRRFTPASRLKGSGDQLAPRIAALKLK